MSENVDGWTADTISSTMSPRLRGAKTSNITPIINLGSSFKQTWYALQALCYISSKKVISILVLENRNFKEFYHILVRRPSCSCD